MNMQIVSGWKPPFRMFFSWAVGAGDFFNVRKSERRSTTRKGWGVKRVRRENQKFFKFFRFWLGGAAPQAPLEIPWQGSAPRPKTFVFPEILLLRFRTSTNRVYDFSDPRKPSWDSGGWYTKKWKCWIFLFVFCMPGFVHLFQKFWFVITAIRASPGPESLQDSCSV